MHDMLAHSTRLDNILARARPGGCTRLLLLLPPPLLPQQVEVVMDIGAAPVSAEERERRRLDLALEAWLVRLLLLLSADAATTIAAAVVAAAAAAPVTFSCRPYSSQQPELGHPSLSTPTPPACAACARMSCSAQCAVYLHPPPPCWDPSRTNSSRAQLLTEQMCQLGMQQRKMWLPQWTSSVRAASHCCTLGE